MTQRKRIRDISQRTRERKRLRGQRFWWWVRDSSQKMRKRLRVQTSVRYLTKNEREREIERTKIQVVGQRKLTENEKDIESTDISEGGRIRDSSYSEREVERVDFKSEVRDSSYERQVKRADSIYRMRNGLKERIPRMKLETEKTKTERVLGKNFKEYNTSEFINI